MMEVEMEVYTMTRSGVQAPRSKLSYSAIATYAEQIARENDVLDEDGNVDVSELLKRLGGEIEIENRAESLHVRDAGDFTVFVPTPTSQLRVRFTNAHELGHYFLHSRSPYSH